MSIEELQSAVTQLPTADLDRFARWFEEFLTDEWDRRIEDDIQAGRLDAAGRRADEDFEAGRCTQLRAVLDHSRDQLTSGQELAHESFWLEVDETERS